MTLQHTSDAELIETLQAIRKYHLNSKAGAVLGISSRTVERRKQMAKARGLTADTKVHDPLGQAEAKIRQLRSELATITRANDSAAEIRKTIYGLAEYNPEPPDWLRKPVKFSGTPGCPVTIWSDWHYGEVVNKAEVGGLNEFSVKIANERITNLVKRTVRLVKGFAFKEFGKSVKFPGIVVALGGDMISGDIHEELADTNEKKPLECINDLLDICAAALEKMADEFGFVYVPCVVGNHGRTTKKPRAKSRVFTSYEWNLYTNLERYFRNDKRFHFTVSENTDVHFSVFGHRYLLTHGDSLGVKGGDGIIGAIGPIQRGNVKTGRSEAQIGRDYDTLVIGHWHSYQPKGDLFPAIVNGTVKGYDEYARLYLRVPYSRPSQAVWFSHEEQGVTTQFPVYVDDLGGKRVAKKQKFIVIGRNL